MSTPEWFTYLKLSTAAFSAFITDLQKEGKDGVVSLYSLAHLSSYCRIL